MIVSFFSLFIWTFAVIYICSVLLFAIFGEGQGKRFGWVLGFLFGGIGSVGLVAISFLISTTYNSFEINGLDKDSVKEIRYFNISSCWFESVIINNTNDELYVYKATYEDPKTHYRVAQNGISGVVQKIPAKSTTRVDYTLLEYDILSMPNLNSGSFVDYKVMTKNQLDEFLKMVNN